MTAFKYAAMAAIFSVLFTASASADVGEIWECVFDDKGGYMCIRTL